MNIIELIKQFQNIVPGFGDRKIQDLRRDISKAISDFINIRTIEHGDTRISYAILRTKDIQIDDDIQTVIKFFSIYPYGKSCSCSHDCCGHWQFDPVYVKEGKYKTLIVQRSYPNI